MTATKQKYNDLLERYYKADKYFEDESIPVKTRHEQLENYQKILLELSRLLVEIGDYTSKEALEGFKI